MAIAGIARTLDMKATTGAGTVIGLYPRPEGVCKITTYVPDGQTVAQALDPETYAAKHGTDGVESVRLVAGRGMEGDRYFFGTSAFSDSKRSSQLTLVSQEDLDAVKEQYGVEMAPTDTLRNIVTSGIPLETLIGKRFRVGDALCVAMRFCEPCLSWEQYLKRKGILKAFVHRSGIRAEILESGMVSLGDTIEMVGDAEDLMVDIAAPSGVRMFMPLADGTLLCGECGSPFGERIGTAGEIVCHRCGIVAPVSDEVRHGTTIRVFDDGPLNIVGPFTLVDSDRKEYTILGNKHLCLCRCGMSATKPFCDVTHKAVTFESAPRTAPRKSVGQDGPATVRVSKDGPYVISGAVTIEDQKGNVYETSGPITKICRCGNSSTAPFCDNSHLETEFISVVTATTRKSNDLDFMAARSSEGSPAHKA